VVQLEAIEALKIEIINIQIQNIKISLRHADKILGFEQVDTSLCIAYFPILDE